MLFVRDRKLEQVHRVQSFKLNTLSTAFTEIAHVFEPQTLRECCGFAKPRTRQYDYQVTDSSVTDLNQWHNARSLMDAHNEQWYTNISL